VSHSLILIGRLIAGFAVLPVTNALFEVLPTPTQADFDTILHNEGILIILEKGFCPFRVEKRDYRAGCALRLGKGALCYTQEIRPLIRQSGASTYFYCPLLRFTLSREIYQDIELFAADILKIQDEEATGINLWPMLLGMANPKNKSVTGAGKEMEKLSSHVREKLEEIVFNLI